MIAGTPVVYGEALLFKFEGGTPGDTAIATVFGLTSDLPPNLDLVPQVPGTHFQGHLSTEIILALDSGNNVVVGPGASIFSTRIDVRQWASYYLTVEASTQGVGTAFNPVSIILTWDDGTQQNYNDFAQFWVDNTVGQFALSLGNVYMQDSNHGPNLQLLFINNAVADSVSISWTLTGTTRQLAQPYGVQKNGQDGSLNPKGNGQQTLANNTTVRQPMNYARGRVWLRLNPTVPMTFTLNDGDQGFFDLVAVAANGVYRAEYILPRRALAIDITNTSGGSGQYNIMALTQYDKVG
jgi:hypothetical protein